MATPVKERQRDVEGAATDYDTHNVFAAMGLPDPDIRLAKSTLSIHIQRLIDALGITQAKAAAMMGLQQPDVSNILRGRLAGYTLERLFRCLNALGQDVRIEIMPKPEAQEQGRVIAGTAPAAE